MLLSGPQGSELLPVMPADDRTDGEDENGDSDGNFHELFEEIQDFRAAGLIGNFRSQVAGDWFVSPRGLTG